MTKKTLNLDDLFDDARSSGVITSQGSSVLSGSLGPVMIAGAAGRPLEQIEQSDITLVTILLDMSTSIHTYGLEKAVCDGYNALLDTFLSSKECDSMMIACWTFNTNPQVIHSYVPLAEAARLGRNNYRPGGWTALYDAWCGALGANVAYAQQLRAGGTPTKSVVVVITDGEDNSSKATLPQCKALSKDLLASEQFALAFVGVGDATDFDDVARRMGIPPTGICVQNQATPDRLRALFHLVSQSAIRVSRSMVMPGKVSGFFVN